MASFDIVGYSFQAEQYTRSGIVEELIARGRLAPGARGMTAEDALDQLAGLEGIDREDEHSFDSEEFPKVVFRDQAEGDFLDHADSAGRGVYLDASEL